MTNDGLVERMVKWFRANYEDPAENTPYEDGYVYLCGGPYDAREELMEEFEGESEEYIDAAVDKIEADGIEWAKKV